MDGGRRQEQGSEKQFGMGAACGADEGSLYTGCPANQVLPVSSSASETVCKVSPGELKKDQHCMLAICRASC